MSANISDAIDTLNSTIAQSRQFWIIADDAYHLRYCRI